MKRLKLISVLKSIVAEDAMGLEGTDEWRAYQNATLDLIILLEGLGDDE